eukprot:CAMPEP_0177613810 /NCGR_PEP_ID=MMETSP0419_2-20121207/22242_1 /TAXON_ID=582737 /ORGANISM="Tetraselmis sp., Strain GSL018" /LENGTH=260 /DNA_ID=CAMNT_0019110669 /DNA_START=281 /DNA_END=1063 /DNA_ORIENTATION=-
MAEDLCDSLLARSRPFGEDSVRRLCRVLLKGLEYLHSRGIVHRDVKLDNIFLERAGDLGSARLGDFGLSTLLHWSKEKRVTGSLHYMAPELINSLARDHRQLPSQFSGTPNATAADLWSVGVVLYALLSQRFPFGGKSDEEIKRNILANKLNLQRNCFCEVRSEALDLVRKLLESDPAKRISAQEALQHPWLKRKPSSFTLLRRPVHVGERNLPSTVKAALRRALAYPLRSSGRAHKKAKCSKDLGSFPLQNMYEAIVSV